MSKLTEAQLLDWHEVPKTDIIQERDALRDRVAELEKALEKIAEADTWSDVLDIVNAAF